MLKSGSQYDAGAASVTEKSFHQSNCIPDVKFFENLIAWTLANACIEIKSIPASH